MLFQKHRRQIVLMVFRDRVLSLEIGGTPREIDISAFGESAPQAPIVEDGRVNHKALKEAVNASLSSLRSKASTADIALGNDLVFAETLPIDDTLSHQALKAHLDWELNHYVDRPENHIVNTAILRRSPDGEQKTMLVVAIPKSWIEALRDVLHGLHLSLDAVDTDHFGAEYFFRAAVSVPLHRPVIALAGVGSSRIDFSLLRNGRTEAYSRRAIRDGASSHDIASDINAMVSALGEDVPSLVLHGEGTTPELLEALRAGWGGSAQALDPLRYITAPGHVAHRIQGDPATTGGIGLGLRSLDSQR